MLSIGIKKVIRNVESIFWIIYYSPDAKGFVQRQRDADKKRADENINDVSVAQWKRIRLLIWGFWVRVPAGMFFFNFINVRLSICNV